MNLSGRTPNGHEFVAIPRQVWLVKSSRAIIRGVEAGPLGSLAEQARLGDFLIPQRGVFAVGHTFVGTASNVSSSQFPTRSLDGLRRRDIPPVIASGGSARTSG
jgi:hypothetical protein